jgi:hypothetical protein
MAKKKKIVKKDVLTKGDTYDPFGSPGKGSKSEKNFAAKAGGKLGQRARLAKTLEKMHKIGGK